MVESTDTYTTKSIDAHINGEHFTNDDILSLSISLTTRTRTKINATMNDGRTFGDDDDISMTIVYSDGKEDASNYFNNYAYEPLVFTVATCDPSATVEVIGND